MKRRSRYVEQEQKKLRLEAIGKLFSTAAITVVTVVAVSVFVPSSPTAILEEVRVFTDRISYRVNVVDPDDAINNDSLAIKLSNQLEQYVTTLNFGYSIGSFSGLKGNTSYLLEVVANKGFGEERLAKQQLKTRPSDGAAILDVRYLEGVDFLYSSSLEIDVVYYNEATTYQSFTLEYATMYEDEPSTSSEPYPLDWISLPILTSPATLTIENYYGSEATLLLRLLGYKTNQDYDVLDEASLPPQFSLYASAYLDQVSTNFIAITFYPDSRLGQNADYRAELLLNGRVMNTMSLPVNLLDDQHYITSNQAIIFNRLRTLTTYSLRFIATYEHPQTLRQVTEVFAELEAKTLGVYEYDFSYVTLTGSYEATITLIDPSHNFQSFFYEVYEGENNYPTNSGQSGFFSPENKTATLVVNRPTSINYRIVFGVRNNINTYQYDEIYTITA